MLKYSVEILTTAFICLLFGVGEVHLFFSLWQAPPILSSSWRAWDHALVYAEVPLFEITLSLMPKNRALVSHR